MNLGVILMIVVAGLWALGLFMGAIKGLSKTFQQTPVAIDSSDLKTQAHQTMEDTEDKRRQMMDDLKRKMQDASHKY